MDHLNTSRRVLPGLLVITNLEFAMKAFLCLYCMLTFMPCTSSLAPIKSKYGLSCEKIDHQMTW